MRRVKLPMSALLQTPLRSLLLFVLFSLLLLLQWPRSCSAQQGEEDTEGQGINNVFQDIAASGITPPASTFHATSVVKIGPNSAFNRQRQGEEEAMVLFGGYRLGGIRYSTRDALNTTYVFSARTPPLWITCDAPVAPEARAFHVMETLRSSTGTSHIILHGGLSDDLTTHFSSTWSLSIQDSQCLWRKLEVTGSPGERAAHGSAVVGNRMYVFGGCRRFIAQRRALLVLCDMDSLLNDLWQFDIDTLTWTEVQLMGDVMPPPRSSPMLATINSTLLLLLLQLWMFGGISPGNASLAIPFFNPIDAFGRAVDSDIGSISDMWRFEFFNQSTSPSANITLELRSNHTQDFVLRNRGALVPISSTKLVLLGLFGLTEPRASLDAFIFDTSTMQFAASPVRPHVDDVALPALLPDDDRATGGFSVSTIRGLTFVFGHMFELRSGDEARLWTLRTIDNTRFSGLGAGLRWQRGVARLQPVARTGAVTMLGPNGTVYVFGGFSGILLRDLWRFTPPSLWQHLHAPRSTRPLGRVEATANSVGDHSYFVFGGVTSESCMADLWRFDTVRAMWTLVHDYASDQAVSTGFRGHTTVVHEGRLYVFGGKCGEEPSSAVFILDTVGPFAVTKIDVTPAPQPRARHLAHIVERSGQPVMTVYGGFVNGQVRGRRWLGDMWGFYINNNTWVDWTPDPIATALAEDLNLVTSLQGKQAVLYFNATNEVGDIRPNMWPERRSGICLFGSTKKFVMFGGRTEGFDLAEAWEFDADLVRWTLLDTQAGSGLRDSQLARSLHTCLLVDDPSVGSRALIFGGEGQNRLNNDVVMVRPTCNYGTGAAGPFFLHSCNECPKGQFSVALNTGNPDESSEACNACPRLTTTAGSGAQSIDECNICDASACEGKSTCVVQSTSGLPTHSCECAFGRSGSRCEVQWGLGVLLGVVLAAVLAAVIFLVIRRYRSQVRYIQDITTLQAKELKEAGHELLGLRRVFEIPYNQIDKRQRIDKYCEGNFGAVYFGYYSGRSVAVKTLKETFSSSGDPRAREDFVKEVKVMRELRDANIVFFFGAGSEPDGRPFLVTEYMDRGSLKEIVQDRTLQLPWTRRYKFALDAAKGMLCLHSKNPPLLHRDLKSANLLVAQDWTVKVADFGTAALSEHLSGIAPEELERRSSVTRRSEGAVGTICWSAPEVLREDPYGLSSDVYSFGIVMFEIASREEPFRDLTSYRQVKTAVLRGQRPAITSNCPVKFGLLMRECWDANPSRRPPFYEVKRRLEECVHV